MKLSDKVLRAGVDAFNSNSDLYQAGEICIRDAFLAMIEAMKEEDSARAVECSVEKGLWFASEPEHDEHTAGDFPAILIRTEQDT
jgi:hypothetical protein